MSIPPASPRLGRGLAALLASVEAPVTAGETDDRGDPSGVRRLPVVSIIANPKQPRKTFDDDALNQLAASLKRNGVIQPLVVRPVPSSDCFEIVAGERRWRAAQRAGLLDVPVIVRDLDDSEVMEVALIENIQRSDLNPLEEAQAYRQLMDRHGHTQEKLAEALSKSRSHVANLLRLLNLPEEVQEFLRHGRISMGHARALITAADPVSLAKVVVEQNLSVRAVETLVNAGSAERIGARAHPKQDEPAKSALAGEIERRIASHLGMEVAVRLPSGDRRGRLTVSLESMEDVEFLADVLARARRGASD